jgi:aminodeoxychorismate lyase
MANYTNQNGKIINENNAVVAVNNRSFRYGDGYFETIKMCNSKIILAEAHFSRMFATLAQLQFDIPSYYTPTYFTEQILQLATKNAHQKCGRIRLTFYRGNGGLYDAENNNANYVIQTWALNTENNKLNENGLVIGLYTNGFKAADPFANLKTNNFLLYAMAAMYAKQQHWNDALVLNHSGTIADSTIANIFIIKNNQITTPPLSSGPIAGTMRQYLLQQLPALGFSIVEAAIAEQDLIAADACFLANSIYGIKWVRQYNNTNYASQQIIEIYHTAIKKLWL